MKNRRISVEAWRTITNDLSFWEVSSTGCVFSKSFFVANIPSVVDCFLKLGTTIALYSTNPDQDEFAYHVERMVLVCNRSLYERAVELELYKYIQTEGFSRFVLSRETTMRRAQIG